MSINDTSELTLQLASLTKAQLTEFALAAAEPLVRVADGGAAEERVRSALGKRWPGGIAALYEQARVCRTAEERASLIEALGQIERAAGRVRMQVLDASILEPAAEIVAHALGIWIHGEAALTIKVAHESSLTGIRQYLLHREFGLPAKKAPVLIPGSAFARARQHPWMLGERERHKEAAARLLAGSPIGELPSRFAREARAVA